ncbi:MAG: peptidylprolyl isomerase [Candidatus Omnitrophica bacterium]|nr:peptidylprolyl isomerase [Candidatus Omnitrophota bacterium]
MRIALSILICFVVSFANPMIVKGEDLMIANGKRVYFDYTLTVEGEVADTSEGKQPLDYIHGQQMIIPGLERQLEGLKIGDERDIHIKPEEGYGLSNPELIVEVPKERFNVDVEPKEGMMLDMQTDDGRKFTGVIIAVKEGTLRLDFNHPLAGKELNFKIKVVDIK